MHSNIPRLSLLKLVSIGSLGLTLLACGGGGGNRVDDVVNKPGSGNSSSVSNVRILGTGSGNNFKTGEIGVGVGSNNLSAGGTTSLTVNLVNADHSLATETIEVIFKSDCIASKEALLSPEQISTTNGRASVSYTANGCVGKDDITAEANINGQVLTARTSLTIEADTVSSIKFEDATPEHINLKGTGGTETSNVRFLVRGSTGAPVKGTCVEFTLPTGVGALNLVDSKCDANDPPGSKRAKTNEDGYASIFVQAGSVSTPVRVTATHLDTRLSTQSNFLYVATGVPDQKSMSLSASVINPHAWEVDGATVGFTVRLADAFNNPPADGTSVSFTTSGGSITPNCITDNGVCSVTWTSQNPRPSNINQMGHVRVLAHTTGNESFHDVNGNGWYDFDIDTFASNNSACDVNVPPSSAEQSGVACDDLGEAFLDRNHTGEYDNEEWFVDFNQNGTRDEGDGLYNGVLCREEDEKAIDGKKCTRDGVTIRRDYLIIMSSNTPYFVNGRLEGQPESLPATGGSFSALLADKHRNPLPAGTKITFDTSNAKNVKASPEEITIPSTQSTQRFPAIVIPDGNEPPSGYLRIVITTPDGLITSTAPVFIGSI